jgi:hypothetical protein
MEGGGRVKATAAAVENRCQADAKKLLAIARGQID